MKNYIIKIAILYCIILVLSSCSKPILSNISNPNIVSYCIGDIDADGVDELLAVSNGGERRKLPTGEDCGKFVDIYRDFSIDNDKVTVGEKPDYSFDFSDIKPSKIQLGDVDGDGRMDISIVMYKKVKFHNALAKRPFFYNFESEKLVPLWLGSRLSRPFDDFILSDMDGDDISELAAIEVLENKNRILAIYKWEGFGFSLFTQSNDEFKKMQFDNKSDELKIIVDGNERKVKLENKTILIE